MQKYRERCERTRSTGAILTRDRTPRRNSALALPRYPAPLPSRRYRGEPARNILIPCAKLRISDPGVNLMPDTLAPRKKARARFRRS